MSITRNLSQWCRSSVRRPLGACPGHPHPPARTTRTKTQFDYLIDGNLRWVGTGNPSKYRDTSSYYSTYSDTGGYVVTSWLTPGLHKFTVRVLALNGQMGSDTVIARVLPAPMPPAALVGSWQRTTNTANAPTPGSPGNPTDTYTPDGTYTITFSRMDRGPFPRQVLH